LQRKQLIGSGTDPTSYSAIVAEGHNRQVAASDEFCRRRRQQHSEVRWWFLNNSNQVYFEAVAERRKEIQLNKQTIKSNIRVNCNQWHEYNKTNTTKYK